MAFALRKYTTLSRKYGVPTEGKIKIKYIYIYSKREYKTKHQFEQVEVRVLVCVGGNSVVTQVSRHASDLTIG